MLDERARAYIERELERLERLLRDYRVLLETARTGEPDLVERTALGSVLQSFYTSIFETIAKRVDRNLSYRTSSSFRICTTVGRGSSRNHAGRR